MRTKSRLSAGLAALALSASLAACAAEDGADDGAADDSAAAASCGPVETAADEGHQHLVGDASPATDYVTTPPTSGWHYQDRERIRLVIDEEPLTEPEHTSVLSVDAVVVSYRDLGDDERARLADMLREEFAGRVAMTRYGELEPGQVALTAWRTIQICEGVDLEAVRAFVSEHAAQEPDFSMGSTGGDDHSDH